MNYAYTLLVKDGDRPRLRRGVMNAFSEREVIEALQRQGHTVIDIVAQINDGPGILTESELRWFYEQLVILLPTKDFPSTLELLVESASSWSRHLELCCLSMLEAQRQRGASAHQALAESAFLPATHRRIFLREEVVIPETFRLLLDMMEQQSIQGLFWKTVVGRVLAPLAMVLGTMNVVIPIYTQYTSFFQQTPAWFHEVIALTRIIAGIGWVLGIVGLGLIGVQLAEQVRGLREPIRHWRQRVLLRVPVIGGYVRDLLSGSMAYLLGAIEEQSMMPTPVALAYIADVLDAAVLSPQLREASQTLTGLTKRTYGDWVSVIDRLQALSPTIRGILKVPLTDTAAMHLKEVGKAMVTTTLQRARSRLEAIGGTVLALSAGALDVFILLATVAIIQAANQPPQLLMQHAVQSTFSSPSAGVHP
jgi:type II secretory pathway component PulF